MANEIPSSRIGRTLSRALLATGAVVIAVGGLIAVGSPQSAGATQDTPPAAAQRLSNEMARFLRRSGYPVGAPRVRSLRLSDSERRAYRESGTAGSIGGISLRGGEIEFSERVLEAAARVPARGRARRAPFQLVKLLMHEQLHQVTWRGRDHWFPLATEERALDEGVTEAIAWDLARVWCRRSAHRCAGGRAVIPDYAPAVRRIRRLAMDATGAPRFTARPAKVWLRAYLTGDDVRRLSLRVAALRQRDRAGQAALRSNS